MPYQNRVDPYGRLHAVAARGHWVGNRGVLINDRREVVRPFRLQRWITCSLQFKNRHREVFTPRRWTELFFLDEVTALSAGHRPCAECRRERYNAFKSGWQPDRPKDLRADAMDAVLHQERELREGGKRTYQTELSTLPSGTMIEYEGLPTLLWLAGLWSWSFRGYQPVGTKPLANTLITVLTPPSIVRVLQGGYVPQIHESLSALSASPR